MAIRQRMHHAAAGSLHSFYSRCNELGGFWTMGMLYEEVQSEPYRVELDLLARTATPADIPRRYFQPHWIGDPFTCTVRLRRADDAAIYTAHGKCMPHDPRLSSRSARARACQRG